MTRTVRHRPSVECLEPRFVLASDPLAYYYPAVYPFGTVGPLPTGARLSQDATGTTAAAPNDEAPYGGIHSLAPESIGGGLNMTIYAGGSGILASVQYTITGGGIAMQTWNTSISLYQRTDGTTHTFPNGAAQDGWTWYWDENPGTKSEQDTVTYTDGSVWLSPLRSYNVLAPTATFTVTVPKAMMVGNPLAARNAIVTYQGTITMGNQPGPATGGFIQLVNMQDREDYLPSAAYPDGAVHGMSFPGDLYALDVPKAQATPYYNNDYKVQLPANTTTAVGGIPQRFGPYYPSDAPGVWIYSSKYGWADKISYSYSFETYLDYAPPGGGIHIALAQATWTVNVAAHWNGVGNINDPAQWVFDTNTVTGPTVTINRQIVTWGINTDDAQKLYGW